MSKGQILYKAFNNYFESAFGNWDSLDEQRQKSWEEIAIDFVAQFDQQRTKTRWELFLEEVPKLTKMSYEPSVQVTLLQLAAEEFLE